MAYEIEPDPVIEEYKKHVDRTLIIENLRRTPQQRGEQLISMAQFYDEAQKARRERLQSSKLTQQL